MKNSIYLIALALLFVFGCQQEPTSSTTGGQNTPPPPSTDPTLSVSADPATGIVDNPVTITASVAEDISGTTARVQLYRAFDSDPDDNANAAPVGCDYSGTITWVMVGQSGTGEGSVDYTWTPTATGNYGFRAHFVKGNSDYNNLIGDCFDLDVVATSSCDGPTVSTSVVDHGSGCYTVTWTICACEEMTNVALSGTIYTITDSPQFDVEPDYWSNQDLSNQEIVWLISSIPAGECVSRSVDYCVSSTGQITSGWTVDFDTDSQSDQQIVADPVVVQ